MSTAVSFEGAARPAGSAVVAYSSRSVDEESALSAAAEVDGKRQHQQRASC